MTPLITNPRFLRVAAPLLIGVLLLLVWQMLCTVLEVPAYLVPTPWLIAKTLVGDWGLLSDALLVTLTLPCLCAVGVGGRRDCLSVCAQPLHRGQPVSLCDHLAGHTDCGDCPADHHLGQGADLCTGDLRHHHGLVSDHLEYY